MTQSKISTLEGYISLSDAEAAIISGGGKIRGAVGTESLSRVLVPPEIVDFGGIQQDASLTRVQLPTD
jgi:hypothetical protein